jgi:hypothetical protein
MPIGRDGADVVRLTIAGHFVSSGQELPSRDADAPNEPSGSVTPDLFRHVPRDPGQLAGIDLVEEAVEPDMFSVLQGLSEATRRRN